MKNKNYFLRRLMLIGVLITSILSCRSNGQKEDGNNIKNESTERIESHKDLSGIKIGYSSPSLNAPFYVALNKSIEKNVKTYGMQFSSVDGQGDITRQITGIEDMVSGGIDALIVNPIDPKAIVPIVNSITNSGIPVFIVDSFIDPEAQFVTSVLAANTENGDLLGKWIANKFKRKPVKMAIISGAQGNPVGRERRLGFISGFTDAQLKSLGYTNLDIVSQGWGGWTISGGLQAMEDILVAHPYINLVVAENDAMAMGAKKAIDGAKDISDEVLVVGFDAQKEALKLIESGELGATTVNSPNELGKLISQSIVKYMNGEKSEGVILRTASVLINKSNVNKYYDPNALF